METQTEPLTGQNNGMGAKRSAMLFVVLMGIVSLFADMTHEGARSIYGPFLALLGVNATIVGIVTGFGELVGYALRLVSGYITDKTGEYWSITIIGYLINMLAVPLLALAGSWEMAAFLIIMERMGKAIRNPVRDAMLSQPPSTWDGAGGSDFTKRWIKPAQCSVR